MAPKLHIVLGGLDSPSSSDEPIQKGPGSYDENTLYKMNEENRLQMMGDARKEIEKLISLSEWDLFTEYRELVAWDENAKLYLGSKHWFSAPDKRWCLDFPNRTIPMREAILNYFREKLRKLKDGAATLPKLTE